MDCESVREWSGAFVLGETGAGPPQEIAQHLASCDACRREVADARAAWAELSLLDVALADRRDTASRKGWKMMLVHWGSRAAMVALAVAVGAALGWSAGRTGAGGESMAMVDQRATGSTGSAYLLLIRETPATAETVSRVGMDEVVREYAAWAGSLAESGQLIGAEKLAEEGTRVSADRTEGVDGAAADAVSGYFLVRAPDREAAAEIARQSPHVRYGGVIEVRPVDSGSGP